MKRIAVLLMFVANLSVAPAATIDIPGDYATIQEGIDAAESGDTVYVHSGTYSENLNVQTSLHLVGESRSTTAIDPNGASPAVVVLTDFATVTGFRITDCDIGVFVFGNHNTISDCTIYSTTSGVFIGDPPGYTPRIMCDHNVITGCLIEDNTYGVELSGFADVVEQNEVIGNVIKNNSYGIYDHGTVANTYTDNMIYGGDTGIYLTEGSDHHIYHNDLFWNTQNAYDGNRSYWDDGYPSGGNYWDDYTGGDLNGDGIGDTPHPIPGNGETDDYPLMYPRSLICGDADMSGQIDIDDIVRMLELIFPMGDFDPPEFLCQWDVNCSGNIDIDDVVYLIAYIFASGTPPCKDCCAPPWYE